MRVTTVMVILAAAFISGCAAKTETNNDVACGLLLGIAASGMLYDVKAEAAAAKLYAEECGETQQHKETE